MKAGHRYTVVDVGVVVVLALVLATRFLVVRYGIHAGDFGSWVGWGERLWANGFGDFYGRNWSDRLPGGVLYLLWALAGVKHLFPGLTNEFIYKLPANLADVIVAWLLYRYGSKKWNQSVGMVMSFLYVFNPFSWHVSSLWGQMDAVQALFLVIVLMLTLRQRYVWAAIFLSYIFLFKPHSIVVAPVICLFMWRQSGNWKQFIGHSLKSGLAAVSSIWAMSLPFAVDRINVGSIVSFYSEPLRLVEEMFRYALGFYPYASVHAFNWWMVVKKNWVYDDLTYWGISYRQWGTTLFLMVVLVAIVVLGRVRKERLPMVLWLAAATIVLAAYTFMTRAHDKHFYAFFALLAFVLFDRHVRRRLLIFVSMMLVGVTNTLYSIEYQYGGGPFLSSDASSWISMVPVIAVLVLLGELIGELRVSKRQRSGGRII